MKNLFLMVLFACISGQTQAQKVQIKPSIGIVESPENDSILAAAGYSFMVVSISRYISPRTVSEAAFQKNVALFQQLKTPVYAVNIFIPGELKLVGPKVNEKAVMAYVDSVMFRLSQTGTRLIIWGSGGARRVPDGFDRKIARRQMIAIGKKIAAAGARYNIVVALENLNSSETNFINTVEEALYIVKKVNHPNLRLDADIYHMLKENEAPDILTKTKKYLVHVEIAEKEQRTPPGVTGADFRPYLRALHQIGYHQKIGIEGSWKNLSGMAAPCLQYLQGQIDEVWKR